MSRHQPDLGALLATESRDANLTYFAFVNGQLAAPAPAAAKRKGRRTGKKKPAPTPPLVPLPQVLAGRYRLERLLGAGGMGMVYRARDLLREQFGDPQPCVAIKLMSEALAASPDANALLFSEFALTRHVAHPQVVNLYSFEIDPPSQRAFITLELLRGPALDKLLCEQPLGLHGQALNAIVLPLLEALACCHARGVFHGDLKPSNVMLGEDGVRLFDFGLGQADAGVLSGLAHLSRERFDAWTPGYAAPELLEHGTLGAAADMYAVACLIYELASGKHPYRRLPSTQARAEQLDRTLTRPSKLPAHCWPALKIALAFDPAQRTISARQLQEALASKGGCWGRVFSLFKR